MKNMRTIGLMISVSILSALTTITVYKYFETPQIQASTTEAQAKYAKYTDKLFSGNTQRTFLSSSPTNFTSAAEKVTPAVVNIKSTQGGGDFDFWETSSYTGSSGSGVVISPDGFIVTNNHVIEDGDMIEVTLSDKRKFEAEVVGTDPSTDLALLKIDVEDLSYLVFGNSDIVLVGEWVLAVGNPFNLESTVTAGIVSAKGRDINILDDEYSIETFIQTDAAVNPGNSGGALVNTNGELIGINTAIITRSGRYEGYSFAIPAVLAQKVVRDLKDFGTVQRGILGVGIDNITDSKAKMLKLSTASGVYISRINKGSAAEEAGLEIGDVIISINSKKTNSIPELQEQVGLFRPGNKLTLEYMRDAKKYSTDVVLKNKQNTTTVTAEVDDKILTDIGFELRDLSKEEIRRLRISGVKVKSIVRDSKIEETNMDPGFIITKVNDQRVETIDDVIKILHSSNKNVVLEGIYENFPGEYYYKFPI